MCLLNFHISEINEEDKIITDLYQKSVGIDCNVFYLKDEQTMKSILESQSYNSYSLCSSIKSVESLSFEKTLKIFDLDRKPYIFFCDCSYAFIAVEVWSESNHRKIFIAGPIRTEDNSSECSFNCINSDFTSLPVLDSAHIEFASQILYNLIEYKTPSPKINPSSKNANSLNESSEIAVSHISNESTFYEIYNASSLKSNKKRIVKSLGYMEDHIRSILKLVASKQMFLAKQISEELIMPITFENDQMQARSYFIGISSLLGHKIAESNDFIYTPKMFYLYSIFIENMSKAEENSNLYSITELFFKNMFNEMVNAYRDKKTETPAIKTVSYIQKNYKSHLDINTIAYDLNFDPSYLCRSFKTEMGVTIRSFITTFRLKKAAQLILTSKKTISTISKDVGYQDVKLFVKHFKNQYGIAPSVYRQALSD